MSIKVSLDCGQVTVVMCGVCRLGFVKKICSNSLTDVILTILILSVGSAVSQLFDIVLVVWIVNEPNLL